MPGSTSAAVSLTPAAGSCCDGLKSAESTVNDVLAHRVTELERSLAQQALRVKATLCDLEEFSYIVAHDLRGPLRTMEGFSRILMEDYSETLPSDARELLGRIASAAERMHRLTFDVLSLSAVTRMRPTLGPVAMHPLLSGILETYTQFKGVDVTIDGSLPTVRANESLLLQVFSNLLGNAVEFTLPDTPPRIRVSHVVRANAVVVCVCDAGIGIDPIYHEQVFLAFERLDASRRGNGMGLAIVKKALARMDGTVGVTSELGRGATFWFALPLWMGPAVPSTGDALRASADAQ